MRGKFWIGVVALSIVWTVLYHAVDQRYPVQDAAGYFRYTQEYYSIGLSHGWLAALKHLWLHRHNKGLFHPALGLPFLILAQGQSHLAVALATTTFTCVFAYQFLQIFLLLLTPWQSALATVALVTSPWTMASSRAFMTESFFLGSAAAALNWYLRSRFLSRSGPTWHFAAWTALAGCVRPDLTVAYFSGPVAVALWKSRGERLKRATPLLAAGLVVLTWFSPNLVQTLHWIYDATFGAGAATSGVNVGVPGTHLIFGFFATIGGLTFLVAFAAAASNIGMRRPHIPRAYLFAWCCLCFVPLLIGVFTFQRDLRYYFFGASVMTASLIALALESQAYGLGRKLSVAAVVLLVVLHSMGQTSYLFGRWRWLGPVTDSLLTSQQVCQECSYAMPRHGTPEAARQIFEFLDATLPPAKPVRVLRVDSYYGPALRDSSLTLEIISREQRKNWTFWTLRYGPGADLTPPSEYNRLTYDAILYGPLLELPDDPFADFKSLTGHDPRPYNRVSHSKVRGLDGSTLFIVLFAKSSVF